MVNPFYNHRERRPRAFWRLVLQLALVVGVGFAVGWLASGALALLGWAPPRGGGTEILAGPPIFLVTNSAVSLVTVVASMWLAGRFLDRRSFADFGFRLGGGWWLDLFFGMALGGFLMTVVFLVELGMGWITVTASFRSLVPGTPFLIAILIPATVSLCVGVYEELLARGYQLRNAAEGLNLPFVGPRNAVLLAWVLSSAFFGYLHAGNPNATLSSTFNVALAGLMLGFGYVLTGELAIPIGLHITWNFFQGSVFGFPVSGLRPVGATFLSTAQGGPSLWTGGPFGPEGGLVGPAAMILGVLLIALWVRLRSGGFAVHTPIAGGQKPDRQAGEHPAQE